MMYWKLTIPHNCFNFVFETRLGTHLGEWSKVMGYSLPSRHTVPKLTPDGHTNMEFGTSGEDSPELGQQPINSRSKYDAYRRTHDGTRTTREGNTNMLIFIVVYTGMTDGGGYTTSY